MIGIGITTTPNRSLIDETLKQWEKYKPEDAIIVVHNDEDFLGVSVSKNRLLEQLDHCDHIFLVDDDTYPIKEGWWEPYVYSDQLHLQYNFRRAPSHWNLEEIDRWEGHVAYDKSRGCVLYIDRRVLDTVGGIHNVFGRHGGEHEDWSKRIHRAGFTKHPFQDVDTKSFHCLDEDRKGISSVNFRDNEGWKYINHELPLYADYKSRDVPVLVARRNDNGHRDRLWRFLKRDYWRNPVFEGYHKDGPFNRSLGLNIAATQAGNWDVAVFIDSDTYVDPQRLEEAIALARKTQKAVSPFTKVVELSKKRTEEILDTRCPIYDFFQEDIDKVRRDPMTTQSLILVVPRNIYEQLGGFDEQFVGWGGEDNAFWKAATIAGGEVLRLEGNVFHLWHEPATREYQPENNLRWLRYKRSRTREDLKTIWPIWS